ncbi:hypothetical protein F4604DRAFT_1687791 [Suillus subluteus]|nr:hypothetical protein F4604DRAFT_1687791 [Suillus subluteus]
MDLICPKVEVYCDCTTSSLNCSPYADGAAAVSCSQLPLEPLPPPSQTSTTTLANLYHHPCKPLPPPLQTSTTTLANLYHHPHTVPPLSLLSLAHCLHLLTRYSPTSIAALACSLPSPAAPTCSLISLSEALCRSTPTMIIHQRPTLPQFRCFLLAHSFVSTLCSFILHDCNITVVLPQLQAQSGTVILLRIKHNDEPIYHPCTLSIKSLNSCTFGWRFCQSPKDALLASEDDSTAGSVNARDRDMVELESDDILHDAAITLLGSEHDAILVAALRVLAALVHDGVCLMTRCKNNANYGSRSTSYTYQTFEATQLLHLAADLHCTLSYIPCTLSQPQTSTASSQTLSDLYCTLSYILRTLLHRPRPPLHPLRPLLHPLVHPAHPLAPS